MISREEQIRYQRQLILPNFGEDAQEKLKGAKVLVVGAGGLGGPVCYYLAAAGIGNLIIVDKDVVDLSNLNRQILHSTTEIGTTKTDSAFKTLSNLNPEINIRTHNISVDDSNIEHLVDSAHIIVDCLDNIKTRHVLNRFSIKKKVPIVHAGIDGWSGQITLISPPETACINCLFETSVDNDEPKPVLGALAGVIGTMQALETIRFLIGKSSLKNMLLYFDGVNMEWTKLPIQKNATCKVCRSK